MRRSLHFLILCLWCLYPYAQAVELLGIPSIEVEETAATIRWETDVECGTRASYGLSPDRLDQRMEGPVTRSHEVRLGKLPKNTPFFYRIGSAKVWLHSGTFTTGVGPSSVGKVAKDPAPTPLPAPELPRPKPPAARQTWGNISTLQDHFDRHGRDFQATSPEDYARQAWEFLQRAQREQWSVKQDEQDGVLRVYDPKTRAFAAYNRDGTTKTYFKPGSADYWERQPGKLMKFKSPVRP
ncbi:hypothetical protein BH11VER1_BH11VER1_27800 [soil metagenome]